MTEKEMTSCWRWVVLTSSFFALLVTGYAQYHAGVMKVALLRHHGGDESMTTWLMSYYAGSFAFYAPVGSIVLNVASCRTCVVLSGVLCLLGFVLSSLVTDSLYLFVTITLLGIGQGMCNTGSFLVLGYYFPDHASIALGVSVAGGALGIFIHPPLLQTLVDWYGLRGALLLSGAIAFQGSVFGAFMRPNSLEQKTTDSRPGGNVMQKLCALFADVGSLRQSPLMSRAMAIFLLSFFIMSLAFHSVLVLLPYHLIHVGGLTPTQASFSVSMSGVGSFISRLASGFLAHDPRVGHVLVYCGVIGVQALVSLSAPSLIAQGLAGCYAYSFMVGLYTGGVFPMLYPILLQIVGLHHAASALGFGFFSFGLGGLLGAPLTELVQGRSSHPYVMFGFIGALFLVSTVLGSLLSSFIPNEVTPPDPKAPFSSSSPSSSPHLHSHHHHSTEKEAWITTEACFSSTDTNQTSWQLRRRLLDQEVTILPTQSAETSEGVCDSVSVAEARGQSEKGCDRSQESGDRAQSVCDVEERSRAARDRDSPEVTRPLLHALPDARASESEGARVC